MAMTILQVAAGAAEAHNRRREAEEAHSRQTEGAGEACRRCGVALRQSAR